MTASNNDWWNDFHVVEMADLFLERPTQQSLVDSVSFLREQLALSSGDRVFDQCCGIGTLTHGLTRHGLESIGVDSCEIYIDRAKRTGQNLKLSSQFFCDDAFEFVPDAPCNGVFNWYSSFGYAREDDRNIKMIVRAWESLIAGGKFAMDVPNFPGLIRNFQFHLVRSGDSNGREITCVRESQLDWRTGQLKQKWKWISPDCPVVVKESALKIYWPHEIVDMLLSVGFEDVKMYGDLMGSSFEISSPRLILVAKKPA